LFSSNYHYNIPTFCKFWAKVRNYYEIRITNEGNCSIFLFLTKKVVLFSARSVFCRMIKICYKFKSCPKSLKIAFAPLHFAKVLIARRATTFGKVDYSENQLLL